MIDLPDHGYISYELTPIDPGGVVPGVMGGPSDIVMRPGYRYSVTFTLPSIRTKDEARIFQSRLERGSRDDVSYPWPLDFRPAPAGTPMINGAAPVGAVIPIKGLLPGYPFKEGQPLAVISGGIGYLHRVTTPTLADAAGIATVPVFPLTRAAFVNNDVVEIEQPRIRGSLTWDGSRQEAFGSRPFQFTITERY